MEFTTEEVRKIIDHLRPLIKGEQEWPCDVWHQISARADLNIWEDDGQRFATVYPVVVNKRGEYDTDTSKGWQLYIEEGVQLGTK